MQYGKWLKTRAINIKKGASQKTRPEPTIYGNCDVLELHFREIDPAVHAKNRRKSPLRGGNTGVMHKLITDMVDMSLNNVWKPCERLPLRGTSSHMVI